MACNSRERAKKRKKKINDFNALRPFRSSPPSERKPKGISSPVTGRNARHITTRKFKMSANTQDTHPMPMTPALLFTVKGTPRPQPRPRFIKGRVVSTVSHHARAWRAAVRHALPTPAPSFTGALEVEIEFVFKATTAERIGQPHTHKPDSDNLAKLILDVLQEAKVIGDDCTVAALLTRKVWGEEARATVQVGLHRSLIMGVRADAPPVVAPDWLSPA